MSIRYKYNSLEDFLIANPLNADGSLNDGWNAYFSVKGREIEATILFADITAFSKRTADLSPVETLIFVNNFFSWITAEALQERPGIVDKYIGDMIMVVFSKEFGSKDHFIDALQTARWMAEHDVLSFMPHMGIASGDVIVGYVGTPLKYNASVFGLPVAIAARCANIKPQGTHSASIILPAGLWKDEYSLNDILPPPMYQGPTGERSEMTQVWEILPKRIEKIKNLPDIEIIEIANQVMHHSSITAAEMAKMNLQILKDLGLYRKYENQC